MVTARAIWNGEYPCLCSGYWTLYVNDIDVSDKIPEELRCEPMDTYGTYDSWDFNNWEEEWTSYNDGLSKYEWIQKNDDWLSEIVSNYDEKESIYYAFQSSDWRYGSCGGCI